jgi:DNA-binding LacI/PurR family transcriptional regulator
MKPTSSRKSPRTSKKKATIHDVAAAAGVSIYAVSRAMNNKTGVNPETRELVLRESRRLGFRPRRVVQRGHFAIIIPDRGRFLPGGYVSNVVFELLNEVSIRGLSLSLYNDSEFDVMSRQVFDGLFVLSWSQQTIDRLATISDTPIVVINRFSLADRYHVVGWDHEAEGRAVAKYLLARGHRSAAFVAPPPAIAHSTRSRLRGFRAEFAAAGFPLPEHLAEILDSSDQLASALARVRERGAAAIYFPGQDRLGIEALRILQRVLGLRVPDDISVVAGENPGWSALMDPPLTTVDAPLELLARHCVDHMIKLIEHRAPEPTEVLIATPIIERMTVRTLSLGAKASRAR